MATIPRSALDYVTRQVNALSADAQARVLRVLESIEWTPEDAASVARCRDIVLQALAQVMPTYTGFAAQAGADLYDAVRVSQVGEAMGATATSGFSQEAMDEAVKGFVRFVVRGSVEQFNGQVLERVGRDVRRSANVSVARNAARDPLHPHYARVPSGTETCGFCLMLASFGFHYTTEEAASHSHDHCDCRVTPDFDNTGVEGYDPDGMYERYNECLSALGGREQLRRDWDSLPEAERAKRIARHGGKRGDAFDSYVNSRAASEIELRDPVWFTSGEHSGIQFADDAVKADKLRRWRSDPGERVTAEKLNGIGYRTEFWEDEIHRPNPSGKGTVTISRPDLSTGIELKTLYGATSENTFKKHMRSARGKRGLRFVVFDLSENESVSHDDARGWIVKYMARYGIRETRVMWQDMTVERIVR